MNELTLNQRLFVNAIAKAARGQKAKHKQGNRPRGERTCPKWLMEKYMSFRPDYLFDIPSKPADLEKVYLHSTGEFVAVYLNHVFTIPGRKKRWTERYMWVWRHNRMVQLTQTGVPTGWRVLKGGR